MSAARQARDAAVHFEAIKLRLAHNRDGINLTLAIQPQDLPISVLQSYVGKRYLVAMVELNDHDEPVVPKDVIEGERAVQSAGMLARDPSFQAFLVRRRIATEATEVAAAEGLRAYLGVNSRADLKADHTARRLFEGLKAEFRRA